MRHRVCLITYMIPQQSVKKCLDPHTIVQTSFHQTIFVCSHIFQSQQMGISKEVIIVITDVTQHMANLSSNLVILDNEE